MEANAPADQNAQVVLRLEELEIAIAIAVIALHRAHGLDLQRFVTEMAWVTSKVTLVDQGVSRRPSLSAQKILQRVSTLLAQIDARHGAGAATPGAPAG